MAFPNTQHEAVLCLVLALRYSLGQAQGVTSHSSANAFSDVGGLRSERIEAVNDAVMACCSYYHAARIHWLRKNVQATKSSPYVVVILQIENRLVFIAGFKRRRRLSSINTRSQSSP